MTPSVPPDSTRRSRLEEVLGEYMERLDRGEAVDREQFLARHPEWAEELRSYFAGSEEVERLARRAPPEPGRVGGAPPGLSEPAGQAGRLGAEGKGRRVGDYELLEQIGQGGMGV